MHVFFSHDYLAAGHAFETTRKAGWVAESLSQRPIEGDGVSLTAPPSLSLAQLQRLHAPEYVEAVRTGQPRALAESQGFTWDAASTAWRWPPPRPSGSNY